MSNAKALIERFAEKQAEGFFPCPRCGRMAMDESPIRNALSRRVDVYVCNQCGTIEALEDAVGSVTPLEVWAIVTSPEEYRMEEICNEST